MKAKEMHMSRTLKFTEQTIQEVFGHEAAEDENKSRLRKYYKGQDILQIDTKTERKKKKAKKKEDKAKNK